MVGVSFLKSSIPAKEKSLPYEMGQRFPAGSYAAYYLLHYENEDFWKSLPHGFRTEIPMKVSMFRTEDKIRPAANDTVLYAVKKQHAEYLSNPQVLQATDKFFKLAEEAGFILNFDDFQIFTVSGNSTFKLYFAELTPYLDDVVSIVWNSEKRLILSLMPQLPYESITPVGKLSYGLVHGKYAEVFLPQNLPALIRKLEYSINVPDWMFFSMLQEKKSSPDFYYVSSPGDHFVR